MADNVKQFGGFGGSWETVSFDAYADDEFAQALNRACGDRIRASRDDARAAWGALSNVDWSRKVNGNEDAIASYSFRAAGDLIASIRGSGHYMDWYCTHPYGDVSGWIEEAMAREGWKWSAS